jgi:hypothetical protein
MTLQSGRGVSSFILHNSISSAYVTNTHPWWIIGNPIGVGYSNSAHGTSSTESIFSTIKLDYKVGSSCLPEVPYGSEEVIIGGKVFINGDEVAMPEQFKPLGDWNKDTKTIELNGFTSKKSVIELGPSGEWDSGSEVGAPSVIKDGSVYKMWHTGEYSGSIRVGYSTSVDGVTWEKQGMVLDIGNSANGDFDSRHVHFPCVIKDGSTYKMWYSGSNNSVWRIGYATSSDGINWTKQGQVFAGVNNTVTIAPKVIKDGSTYKMWYSSYSSGDEEIRYATSSNGTSWTDQGVSFNFIYQGSSRRTNAPIVIKDGNLYKMFLTFYIDSMEHAGYAISSNGINWKSVKKLNHIYSSYNSSNFDNHRPMLNTCVIKDDSAYKFWYYAHNNSHWEIGYGVLAMSDPNNTGSSTTGVYTNTNPQVNFGFTSNDTIVLHYERIAQQKSAKAETLDVWPKDVSWVSKPALGGEPTTAFNSLELTSLITYNNLGTILRLDPSQYSINSNKDLKYRYGIYMTSALDYVEEYYRISYGTGSYEGFTFEDVRMNITPDSNILKGDYSSITFSSPAQYRLNGSESNKNEETLNCLIGTSIAKRDNGEIIMLIGFVNASIHHPIFYAIGALGATIPMLGRPLLK